ncbi:sulfurtransferase complex subunit TusC [Psychromonas sp. PT13]|uniref:sulfurtransferase complex subunit TusC n=1 Tax=Psychromonas sp. PT13 TaxID=3439547 RepID=UPI003EBE5AE2
MMNEKKIGIINRCGPHGTASGRESLDLSLALSAYNESLSLFFIGDGVYQLVKGHSTNQILQKNYQPLFKMLEMYDVENIYVCSESLQQRHLDTKLLLIEVSFLETEDLQIKLAEQDQLLSF